ncbi:hypothetical protein [Nocardia sp. MW-W600-9]
MVEDRGDVVTGAAGGVDAADDVGVVVELAGIVVVVVLVGAVFVVVGTEVVAGADVTVTVEGVAVTVTVLGSAVTVTVDVSAGVTGTVTVDVEVGATVPGSCMLNVPSIERLAVAEKLAPTEGAVEFAVAVSVGRVVVVSVAVAVLEGSASDGAVPASAAEWVPGTSPGTMASLGASDVTLVWSTLGWLRAAL